MDAAVICFTLNGYILAQKVKKLFDEKKDNAEIYTKSQYLKGFEGREVSVPLKDWAGEMFKTRDALVFIGACGICVRSIAPFVGSKKTDPAVIVMDERGKYCIPLLSGHLGGANALAEELSLALGSQAVLTTATDVNGLFAVDVFAKENGLFISDMALAKEISAALLSGQKAGFESEFPLKGNIPEELDGEDKSLSLGIYVGIYKNKSPFKKTLFLIPEVLCAGIGCRRGKSEEEIEELYLQVLEEEEIFPEALCGAASIDLKKDEAGLKAFSEKRKVDLTTYSADELLKVRGDFSSSEFVSSVTGADNVCERSAVLLSAGGRLIHKKTARDGVTVALALKNKEIYFE